MTNRCCIYSRYSSDLQNDTSIDQQLTHCRALAEKNGWEIVAEYEDRALTGRSEERPGFQALMADARLRRFDYVVAFGLDRLSRRTSTTIAIEEQLSFLGIGIYTSIDGHVKAIDAWAKGYTNASFSETLGKNTHRGMHLRASQGKSAGGRRYGYRSQVSLVDDKRVVGDLEVIEEQAAIVRRIYQEYADGKSPLKICFGLNREGVPSPHGRGWTPSTLLGKNGSCYGILQSEIYIGKFHWGRTRRPRDPFTGKRVIVANPESEWLAVTVPHLRVVSDELFAAVQQRKAALSRKGKPRQQVRPVYLTSGLVKCHCCKGGYTVYGEDHIKCSTAKLKGTCPNTGTVRLRELEDKVLGCLKNKLMDHDLTRAFSQHYKAFLVDMRGDCNADRAKHEGELTQVSRSLDKLVDAIKNGIDVSLIREEMNTLGEKKKMLIRKLESAVDVPVYVHENMADAYQQGIAQWTDLLKDPAERDRAINIIRKFIREIVVQPLDDGTYQINVRGNIQSILSMSAARTRKSNQKHTEVMEPHDSEIEQIEKLIADTCYDDGTKVASESCHPLHQMTTDYGPHTPLVCRPPNHRSAPVR